MIGKEQFLDKIKESTEIYIMGHADLDLDALGCAVGLVSTLRQLNRQSHIIINDETHELAVTQVLAHLDKSYSIKNGNEISPSITDLLIVVDTNKKSMVQDEKLLTKFKNIMIIDHHQITEDTISCDLSYIDTEASSACELLTTLLNDLKITLPKDINTLILAGIILDTNNFVVKTDERAYHSAYLLAKNGADPREVQYLLKQDINDYISRQKVITNVQLHGSIAITRGETHLRYRREDLAKIADTLLQFKGIEASFVIGTTGFNTVGISARSMGNIPIANILEHLGGGGDTHDAAARTIGKTISEVESEILYLISQK